MNHVTVPAQDSGIDGLLPHGLCLLTLHLFRSSSSFPLTSCLSFVGFFSLSIISHFKSDIYPIYSVPLIIQWCRATSHPAVLLFSPPKQLNCSSPVASSPWRSHYTQQQQQQQQQRLRSSELSRASYIYRSHKSIARNCRVGFRSVSRFE